MINVGDVVLLLEWVDNIVSVGELMCIVYNFEYFSYVVKFVDILVLDDEWWGKCEKVVVKVV